MTTPYRVLVVDDDENFGQIMAETLTAAGYEVQTADDGLHGYLRYLDQQPEIVLTDIQMPELDGLEMMRCIRSINPNVKAIYISGAISQYQEALRTEGEEYGALVLNKPFSRKDLLVSVSGWLGEDSSDRISSQRPLMTSVKSAR
ncbi:MAG TPA: response regulator [Candidatus Polarisedimenticolaceae bacterium]|nr:response regulator [Candidatus Polarisedimenticolaceae bacterium]